MAPLNAALAPQVIVTLDGGLVRSVLTPDGTPVRVLIMDYDTEGSDVDRLTPVPQGDGKTAFVHEPEVTMLSPAEMAAFFATVGDDDDGCPVSDPDCTSGAGDCHDACVAPKA